MTTWLIDRSAIARLHRASAAAEWASRIERGLVRISTVTRLEVGFSARSAPDHRSLLREATGRVDARRATRRPLRFP